MSALSVGSVYVVDGEERLVDRAERTGVASHLHFIDKGVGHRKSETDEGKGKGEAHTGEVQVGGYEGSRACSYPFYRQ